jgi:hypothetical protein
MVCRCNWFAKNTKSATRQPRAGRLLGNANGDGKPAGQRASKQSVQPRAGMAGRLRYSRQSKGTKKPAPIKRAGLGLNYLLIFLYYSLGGKCLEARPASEQKAITKREKVIIRKDIVLKIGNYFRIRLNLRHRQ